MGNEHVIDKQLKNGVFMAFGVIQEIIQANIAKERQTPENPVFSGFSSFPEILSDTTNTLWYNPLFCRAFSKELSPDAVLKYF